MWPRAIGSGDQIRTPEREPICATDRADTGAAGEGRVDVVSIAATDRWATGPSKMIVPSDRGHVERATDGRPPA